VIDQGHTGQGDEEGEVSDDIRLFHVLWFRCQDISGGDVVGAGRCNGVI
jgi:hypothetical protein